jgi:drug/metabolite transporter (DMT)-like permease
MRKMTWGLASAILWALDTVILSIALSSTVFLSTPQAIAVASFTSTFIHDTGDALYMLGFNGVRRKLGKTWKLLRSKTGLFIVIAALIGGPIGMSGYVYAVNQIGAAYTSAISAFYPAFGAVIAHFFLKDRLKPYQWGGLMVCLLGVILIGFNPDSAVQGNWILGVLGALVTVVGWGVEANIVSYAMRFGEADEECCLQIRETTSSITFMIVILPALGAWPCTLDAIASSALPIILLASLAGTASHLCYYMSIRRIGAPKSMGLNVSYSGWAVPISMLLLGTTPTPLGVICTILIIAGSIVTAIDINDLRSNGKAEAADSTVA